MLHEYLLIFGRMVTGFVFLISFVGKARNIPAFEQTIAGFRLLSPRLSRFTAWLFLAAELAVLLLLVAGGRFLSVGFALAILLLLLFSLALTSVLLRNLHTPCNCFGTSAKQVSPFDVLRNAGLIFCALIGWAASITLDAEQLSLSMMEAGLVGMSAIVFVAIWLNSAQLVQLFRHR